MGTRNLDKEPIRHHRESHRRPHGADKSRKDSLDDRGMEEFIDSLEGTNIGARKHSTRVSPEDHKGKAKPVSTFLQDKEAQDKKDSLKDRRHSGHRHGEHLNKEHAPGCKHAHGDRKHKDHGHKEHPPRDHRRKEHSDGDPRHKKYSDEDHCPKEDQHGEHRHKKHPNGGHQNKPDGDHERKKHPNGDHQHKKPSDRDHRHGERPDEDHRHKKHPIEEHRHKEHEHGEHRHKEHHKGNPTTEKDFNNKIYESALLPFRETTGSPYKCKQSEIDFHHRGVFEKPNNGPFVSRMQATEEVMRWNDEKRAPPREELEMIRQLAVTVHDAEKNTLFHADIVVKAFADLDRVFFGGRLRGNVTVQWVREIARDEGEKGIYGETKPFRNGQCRITLNATKILLQRWRKVGNNSVASMFGTLLHEMCHAYDFVRCLNQKHVDAHDKCWQTMIGVIHDRCCRILGTWAIESWEPYKQHYFLSKEEEKSRKEALGSGIGGGKKYVGSERKGRRISGAHKGTDCVVM